MNTTPIPGLILLDNYDISGNRTSDEGTKANCVPDKNG
jgi:hypothetical protein